MRVREKARGMSELSCFKADAVRGKLGVELNAGVAARIEPAFGQVLAARVLTQEHLLYPQAIARLLQKG